MKDAIENCALCGHPHPREYIRKLNIVQAELTAKEPGKLTDASGGRGKFRQVGTPTMTSQTRGTP